ncbi:hypothetical protein [Azotobacter beijerinckii]|uniref:Uncharacterized protein n=1 Tax=Azotobacter beijerinckii TaxID=170623 RepID=A0A1I4ATX2_9GAMM|nr:hypothetical protein [Azotobacter beijerinckii]SFB01009.1 hypothetical protein SAMN04244571_01082 [Azotobacter beijerinckii]SFK59159.1 hypothetical protein SAMN04244574_01144 [Azotobacter beijerinckii]
MSMTGKFSTLLDETEARFQQRQQIREEKEQLLREGKIFEANSEQAIKQRLSHLHMSLEEVMGATTDNRGRVALSFCGRPVSYFRVS